ncbi:MAG: bifunctional phosphoserine phosphatase/homoserine phosphotransferase ThrH [Pseudomonadota bacterium]
MRVLCLDLEGVLIPEVWQAVAKETGIDAFNLTTRDIPDYDELMQMRLRTLSEHDLSLSRIDAVIDTLVPLPGAVEFLNWARTQFQVAIISDTFYGFARPLMAKLGYPMLLCHQLVIENDRIVNYRLRQRDPKRHSVQAFQSLTYEVFAAGDSFNDLSMLQQADRGFWLHAPDHISTAHPEFPRAANHQELIALLEAANASPPALSRT